MSAAAAIIFGLIIVMFLGVLVVCRGVLVALPAIFIWGLILIALTQCSGG